MDYLLESVSATAVLLTGNGRFVQDLLLWSTSEFGYLRLGDGFVQSSSIMPQNAIRWRSNTRAPSEQSSGAGSGYCLSVHNTPFGDIVDTEDDLQPLVASVYRDATRTMSLIAAAMKTAEFDPGRMEAHAGDGWTTLTELADTLVRDRGMAFKTAHAIAARLVAARAAQPGEPLEELMGKVSAELLGAPVSYTAQELAAILSPRHFVAVRRTWGGPAPEETARALTVSLANLEATGAWHDRAFRALRYAEGVLRERAALHYEIADAPRPVFYDEAVEAVIESFRFLKIT